MASYPLGLLRAHVRALCRAAQQLQQPCQQQLKLDLAANQRRHALHRVPIVTSPKAVGRLQAALERRRRTTHRLRRLLRVQSR